MALVDGRIVDRRRSSSVSCPRRRAELPAKEVRIFSRDALLDRCANAGRLCGSLRAILAATALALLAFSSPARADVIVVENEDQWFQHGR